MPEQQRYTLPTKPGDQRQLGELTGAACATLVAEIAERHAGPIVLIAPDMQNALRLHDEVRQFTDQLVMNLADWETLLTTAFPHTRNHLFTPVHALPVAVNAARRIDCSGKYVDAARLPAQLFARPRPSDEKGSAFVARRPARTAG